MPTEKNIKTPELLYSHFEKYKKYAKDNPKYENVYNFKQDRIVAIPREIAYTWDGFEIWLRANKILAKLDDYKANLDNRYAAYTDIIHDINGEIRGDKMDGAIAGIFQHNIIARDLGLVETNEIKGEGIQIQIVDKIAD